MGKVIIYNGGQRKMNFIKKKGLGIGLCIVLAAIATLLCKIQAGSFSFDIWQTCVIIHGGKQLPVAPGQRWSVPGLKKGTG